MKQAKFIVAGLAATAIFALSTVAGASSCANVSRPPAACGLTCTAPVTTGNWVWLPSIGVPFPAWGMAPPGSPDSVGAGLPGANGNYTNGQTVSLLGVSAICNGGALARQTTHGIQTGCE